jgi:Spx/MgsR family transcriptional regulator
MYKLYGIPNCDTVKKARTYLDKKGVPVNFIDFKKSSPTNADIERWSKAFGGLPVNTKGATYKKHQEEYEGLSAKEKVAFLIQHTSMIKRPILEKDGDGVLCFGFDEESYKSVLA